MLYIYTGLHMPDKQDYFRCPLCRSVSCGRLVVKRRNGSDYVTPFYHCNTCTIVFLDPLSVTRGFEDRPKSIKANVVEPPYKAWSQINQSRKDRSDE